MNLFQRIITHNRAGVYISRLAIDALFPPLCVSCGNYIQKKTPQDFLLCSSCVLQIPLNPSLFCPICNARIPGITRVCHHGEKSREYPFLLAAASSYQSEAIKDAVSAFKYGRMKNFSTFFAELLINFVNFSKIDISDFTIVPVPLHFLRERTRGFNQSEIIGRRLHEKTRTDFSLALSRVRYTKPQAHFKNKEQRLASLKGAFSVRRAQDIKNKKILLIDDVYTSGATIKEATCELSRAGARSVIALVAAKAG